LSSISVKGFESREALDLEVKSLAYSWSGFQRNLVEIQDTRKFTDLVTVFNFAVPESFPGENLLRAETLSSGPVGDRCHELLKLLIFYISNNFERDSPFSASRSFDMPGHDNLIFHGESFQPSLVGNSFFEFL
jgi:hypothetical protein